MKASFSHCRLHGGKDDARGVGNGAVEVKNYMPEFCAHEVQIYNIYSIKRLRTEKNDYLCKL